VGSGGASAAVIIVMASAPSIRRTANAPTGFEMFFQLPFATVGASR